jgi:hypothetical protein
MDSSLQPLFDLAFARSPAPEANQAIDRARTEHPGAQPSSYEIVVKSGQTLSQLTQSILPRLIYHLESLGSHPPDCGDVFLSIFVDDTLYFVHARDGVALMANVASMSIDELIERYGTGELRRPLQPDEQRQSEPRREPLLLPDRPGGH